ncbi:caskin-1-like [Anopheles cruzii]|uniref:caskin-1-like n=1 Tax=Anopheles cruzii TaxID=68878 RepID=UPI0022EC2D8D|nr:caskin-1-like [Anopheles cruzii]
MAKANTDKENATEIEREADEEEAPVDEEHEKQGGKKARSSIVAANHHYHHQHHHHHQHPLGSITQAYRHHHHLHNPYQTHYQNMQTGRFLRSNTSTKEPCFSYSSSTTTATITATATTTTTTTSTATATTATTSSASAPLSITSGGDKRNLEEEKPFRNGRPSYPSAPSLPIAEEKEREREPAEEVQEREGETAVVVPGAVVRSSFISFGTNRIAQSESPPRAEAAAVSKKNSPAATATAASIGERPTMAAKHDKRCTVPSTVNLNNNNNSTFRSCDGPSPYVGLRGHVPTNAERKAYPPTPPPALEKVDWRRSEPAPKESRPTKPPPPPPPPLAPQDHDNNIAIRSPRSGALYNEQRVARKGVIREEPGVPSGDHYRQLPSAKGRPAPLPQVVPEGTVVRCSVIQRTPVVVKLSSPVEPLQQPPAGVDPNPRAVDLKVRVPVALIAEPEQEQPIDYHIPKRPPPTAAAEGPRNEAEEEENRGADKGAELRPPPS